MREKLCEKANQEPSQLSRTNSEDASPFRVALRTCSVTCRDLNGVEHTVEVTADSLYEAVAHGLRAFQEADWTTEIGRSQTTIKVAVKQPEIEHAVRIRDFETWLESTPRSPAEMSLNTRLRQLLSK